ncbi:MAG: type IV secretion system DNA-binding domain-containing protein [bacterium]|nr:type IV secretion system DNA-binding domain-containing protein [bacterium]
MSAEEILVARARSHVFISRMNAWLADEIIKGCDSTLHPQPVALEPRFEPIGSLSGELRPDHVVESPPAEAEVRRFQVWMSPQQPFDWNNSELFLKQLSATNRRVGFEIIGNASQILILLLCYPEDREMLRTVFHARFEHCELTEFDPGSIQHRADADWARVRLLDFYPPPPYSRLLTRPAEFQRSPFETLIQSMFELSPKELVWLQVLFQPALRLHEWHRNIEILLDLEYHARLLNDSYFPHRLAQQLPSGDLRRMSNDADGKAHNDKPIFAVSVRMAYLGSETEANCLEALSTFIRFFQHGGRPLHHLNETDYRLVLTPAQIREMFWTGIAYRPGFLVNSLELTGLAHLPASEAWSRRNAPIDVLETLPPRSNNLSNGTHIGTCHYADQAIPIRIPLPIRLRHTQLIGRSGMGKSSTLEQMILNDAEQGYGVAVLDPHGDLIDRLLRLIPAEEVDRTIFFNPGDADYAPLWNPLTPIAGQDVGRMADDLVNAFKNVVTGWGDRLEHLLRHALYALIQLPETSLLDVSRLMSFNSPESKTLRRLIKSVVRNESARQFWSNDFEKYGKEDFGPPKHKLSKLLLSDTVSLMLSQPENRFDFRRFMDEGAIVLIDLSSIGSEARDVLGGFLLAIFRLTALSRANSPAEKRRTFQLYCDEAHRFISGAIEDLIAETRKFGVGLTLAHQYLNQFNHQQADALSSVGSCIIFNVDARDARLLSKDLRETLAVEDLITLGVGEAVVRIGTEIVRIQTPPPRAIPASHFKQQIIERSHRLYYKPKRDVLARIHKGFAYAGTPQEEPHPSSDEEFQYDEFD